MLKRLLPREVNFFTYFESHAALTAECAKEFQALTRDESRMVLAVKRIKELEHMADERVRQCLEHLHKTFLTPFDRNEIHALITALDDVMDLMEEAVDAINLFQIKVLPEEVGEQIEVLQRAAALTAEAMPRLRTMKDLSEYWIEINRLENTGDQVHRRIIAQLFNGETDALTVMKVKDVVDSLEAGMLPSRSGHRRGERTGAA